MALAVPVQLVSEGVRARQLLDSLLMDKQTIDKEIQQANISFDFFDVKASRVEDQVFLRTVLW